jgi:hypothetical protein
VITLAGDNNSIALMYCKGTKDRTDGEIKTVKKEEDLNEVTIIRKM